MPNDAWPTSILPFLPHPRGIQRHKNGTSKQPAWQLVHASTQLLFWIETSVIPRNQDQKTPIIQQLFPVSHQETLQSLPACKSLRDRNSPRDRWCQWPLPRVQTLAFPGDPPDPPTSRRIDDDEPTDRRIDVWNSKARLFRLHLWRIPAIAFIARQLFP